MVLVLTAAALAHVGCSTFEVEETPAGNEAGADAGGNEAGNGDGAAPPADAALPSAGGDVNMAGVSANGGYAYFVSQNFGTPPDVSATIPGSRLRLFEDAVDLGPAHAYHVDIRNSGQGRFSHWVDGLYFSASDNTDPRSNGRRYTYRVYDSKDR